MPEVVDNVAESTTAPFTLRSAFEARSCVHQIFHFTSTSGWLICGEIQAICGAAGLDPTLVLELVVVDVVD